MAMFWSRPMAISEQMTEAEFYDLLAFLLAQRPPAGR